MLPAPAFAESLDGTILKFDKQNGTVLVKTGEGEKTLLLTKKTLGLEHAIEGAHVRIEFSRTDNGLSASEINPVKPGARG
jgi:hypothetical protein